MPDVRKRRKPPSTSDRPSAAKRATASSRAVSTSRCRTSSTESSAATASTASLTAFRVGLSDSAIDVTIRLGDAPTGRARSGGVTLLDLGDGRNRQRADLRRLASPATREKAAQHPGRDDDGGTGDGVEEEVV